MDFPASTSQRLETGPRGTLRVVLPQGPLVLYVAQGHLDAALAQHILTHTNLLLAQTRLPVVFHDWEALTSYDSAARELLTRYVRSILPRLGGAHILVRSRLVATGVAVANALLGGSLNATSSRPDFEAALREVLARPSQAA